MVVVIVVVGLVIFASISRESQSYRDGVSVGGAIYSSDASGESAQQACKTAELRGAGQKSLPSGVNAEQWTKGCVNAFIAAQGGN
jgi:hypothetical protein